MVYKNNIEVIEWINRTRPTKRAEPPRKSSRSCVLLRGWAAAVASVISYPYIFGAAAIILGIRVSKGGSRMGMPLVAASILLMAAGLMMNGMLYDYLRNAVGI